MVPHQGSKFSGSGSNCSKGLQDVRTSQIRCSYGDIKEIISRNGEYVEFIDLEG